MNVDMSPIVGNALDTVHIEGNQGVVFVTLDGPEFYLTGMRLDSYDGELCDLLDGVVDVTRVHNFGGGFVNKRAKVDVKMSTGAQVSFNFSGGLFDNLCLR